MSMTQVATMNYFDGTLSRKNRIKNIKKYLVKSLKIGRYNNLLDALYVSKFIRKLAGVAVLELVNTDNGIVTKFSPTGFIFFLIWYSLYFYCTHTAYVNDQTILRNIFDTKAQRYGDDCEKITSLVYVLLAIWKIPFGLSGNSTILKIFINVDKTLEKLGEKIDYNMDARSAAAISIGEIIVYLVRILCIWLVLKNLNVDIPIARVYQAVFADTVVLIVTAFYFYVLRVLRSRLRYTNKILTDINTHKSWEYKIFVRRKMTPNVHKVENLQDMYICEKIKACARIYGMLHKSVIAINDIYGFILLTTMAVCLVYVILYLFYFMEATAAGLFHDLPTYIDFSIYVFWQAVYSAGILLLIVKFCESVMREARETSYILHEMMSGDLSASVSAEAMQLSLQLLHQRPVFTAFGLYKLNYALLEQGARSVSTYLVILLQFVTDNKL